MHRRHLKGKRVCPSNLQVFYKTGSNHWALVCFLTLVDSLHNHCVSFFQILAVYDRFGRLSHGSEVIAKDVLEYVVFEKHLANEYGVWRVHAKIVPPWLENVIDTPRSYVAASPS